MKQRVERMKMKQQWVGRTNGFLLEFFSWSNRRQGADRTRGELGTGRALLGFLPNEWSRLIGSENERHGIS
jgi:hypothetical protein